MGHMDRQRITCSNKCRYAKSAASHKQNITQAPPEVKTCLHCKQPFSTRNWQKVYCCAYCAHAGHHRRGAVVSEASLSRIVSVYRVGDLHASVVEFRRGHACRYRAHVMQDDGKHYLDCGGTFLQTFEAALDYLRGRLENAI
jgi:ribosomal protein L37AE/L43A